MTRTHSRGLAAWVDGARTGTGVHEHRRGERLVTDYPTISARGDLYAGVIDAVRPGGRATVALALPNGAELVAALTGSIRAGADVYCLSSQDRAESRHRESVRARLGILPPDILVTSDLRAYDDLASHLDAPPRAEVVLADDLTGTPGRPADRSELFRLVQFTSGSTAEIKGVQISARAFARTIETIEERLAIGDDDSAATWLPITHDMGLIGLLCQSVAGMNDVHVFQPVDFIRRPWSFLQAMSDHRVTITALPPFALGLILSRLGSAPAGLDLSAVRAILIGGERVNPELVVAFEQTMRTFGLRPGTLLPSYGSAETTVAISIPHGGAPLATAATTRGSALVGCGDPVTGTSVRVVDDAGHECPDGVVGEIVVDSATLADGYLVVDPATTQTVLSPLSNPWRTGDAGLVRDGEVFPVGRLGDAIKVRGAFLHAEDIEQTAVSQLLAPLTVVLGDDGDRQVCLVVCRESLVNDAIPLVTGVVNGMDSTIAVVAADPRHMSRTTSGKPRRSEIWRSWQSEVRHPEPISARGTNR